MNTIELPKPIQRALNQIAHSRALLHQVEERMRLSREIEALLAQGLTPAEALAAGPMPAFAHLGANPAEYRRATVQQWRAHEISALPVIGGSV